MNKKDFKIVIASSVGVDYFFFLAKTIENAGFDTRTVYHINELEYRKLAKASGLKKFWLRLKMYLIYPIKLLKEVLVSDDKTVFIITSNTFYAPFLVKKLLFFKKTIVIHLLYDLFPDGMEISGNLKFNSTLSKILGLIAQANQKKSNSTVYLGNLLREHTEKRWGGSILSAVIDISTDLELYQDYHPISDKDEKILIHYGGQLGHFHDSDSIIESVIKVNNSELKDKIEFNFYVSGANANYLEDKLKEYPVKIISAVPSAQWREDIRSFNIGLVSLSPGGATVCLPSKTYGMMGGGLSIIAICPIWSDLSNLVIDNNAGWVINNSPYEKLSLTESDYYSKIHQSKSPSLVSDDFLKLMRHLYLNRDEIEQKRENAFKKVRDNYSMDSLSNKWRVLINNTIEDN